MSHSAVVPDKNISIIGHQGHNFLELILLKPMPADDLKKGGL